MAPPTSQIPNKGKGKALDTIHGENNTIRAQSRMEKTAPKQASSDKSGLSKDVQKAVLASPLTIPWPDVPRHLQTTVVHLLRELIPSDVAGYHVSRARCHNKAKRAKRVQKAKEVKASSEQSDSSERADQEQAEKAADEDAAMEDLESSEGQKQKQSSDNLETELKRPERPEILSHLVLGINEVIKSIEHQIGSLKTQIMIMGDALNGDQPGKPNASNFLPTAPRSPSPSNSDDEATEGQSQSVLSPSAPVNFIIIPLLSINPQSLVSPILQYCATYNAYVYQHTQLAKILRTRLKKSQWTDVIGDEREEIAVVPLGAVEKDLADMVGLRRLACLALRKSHPNIERARTLLPKSILRPPRFSVTLPIPTSTLKIHTCATPSVSKSETSKGNQAPIPHVHYVPLHVKGIQTKMPVDNASKKAKRLQEVRLKRAEAKIKKKASKERAKKAAKKK
ncbi:hypothetical protein IAS59_005127 [Cryptococcus gattii]